MDASDLGRIHTLKQTERSEKETRADTAPTARELYTLWTRNEYSLMDGGSEMEAGGGGGGEG